MAVGVDKPRCSIKTGAIDAGYRAARTIVANAGDAVTGDGYIVVKPGVTAAVDDQGILNDQVIIGGSAP